MKILFEMKRCSLIDDFYLQAPDGFTLDEFYIPERYKINHVLDLSDGSTSIIYGSVDNFSEHEILGVNLGVNTTETHLVFSLMAYAHDCHLTLSFRTIEDKNTFIEKNFTVRTEYYVPIKLGSNYD